MVSPWAKLVSKHALKYSARDRLGLTSSGVVHRHSDRGEDQVGRRERYAAEDEKCLAGARNPADIVRNNKAMLSMMSAVRRLLLRIRADNSV